MRVYNPYLICELVSKNPFEIIGAVKCRYTRPLRNPSWGGTRIQHDYSEAGASLTCLKYAARASKSTSS